mmetsp:Transcript_29024/g.75297  ORF Transcript_29024/g.75297 Transcript_29024/m.75297 type:complete len:247 (-) Transcript_29024:212-952(-)
MCSTLVPEASASSLQAVTRRSGGLVVCGSRFRPRSPSRMSVVSSREGGGGKCVACGIHAGSRPSVLPQSARDNDRRTAASNPGTCGDAGGVRPWVWHGVNKSLPSCEELHCIALVCVGRRQHVLEDRLHGDVGHADHHGDKDGRPEAEEAVLELANTADARELPLGHCIVAESVYSDVRTGALVEHLQQRRRRVSAHVDEGFGRAERLEQPLVADDAVDDDLHALALHLRAQADQRRPGLRHVAPG